MTTLLLALFSGAPALLYEVVWTRELALLAGSQIESISLVLVVFFGGLALGSRAFGPVADRVASPLRLYAVLEIAAGLLAVLSTGLIRGLAEVPSLMAAPSLALVLAAGLIFPVTVLLGGTLPALLRADLGVRATPAGRAGLIVGCNTLGALVGIAAAVAGIPTLGLFATIASASAAAVGIGLVALAVAGRLPSSRSAPRPGEASRPPRANASPRGWVVAAAGLAGVATLGTEVLAARVAALTLGSSLYAWAAVLFLFLAGLASGNLCLASRAAASSTPERDLGWVEVAAAGAIVFGTWWHSPALTEPAAGLTRGGLIGLALGSFPPAFFMGGAFPFFVRLCVERHAVGADFGATSAANTAGGVLGALLAPFVLLPSLGPAGGLLACAGLNFVMGAAFLARADALRSRTFAVVAFGLALVSFRAAGDRPGLGDARVLFARHGRQASVAVVRTSAQRDLIVDGDLEASTAGSARVTEEILASLPLVLHPAPRALLEIGLGSGITLGTASLFPLERIDCVELVPAVIEASGFFAPDNRDPASGRDSRIRIRRGDGRAFLAAGSADYDVVVANTLHPWSLGATGLYSREYFERVSRNLREGGIAAQWLPITRIGATHLQAILRTFFEVFPHGGVWWGDENVIVVGSGEELPELTRSQFAALPESVLQLLARRGVDFEELLGRRLASARDVRAVVGAGVVLTDDLPLLETSALLGRASSRADDALGLVLRLVTAAAAEDPDLGALQLWIESRVRRQGGDSEHADGLEQLADAAGLELAFRARAEREARRGNAALLAGDVPAAEAAFRSALLAQPSNSAARFGSALASYRRGDSIAARRELEGLVRANPGHTGAWSLLGAVLAAGGDTRAARAAFDAALSADPFQPEALANSGLLAAEAGDREVARERLERLREIDSGQVWPETAALEQALRPPSAVR